MNLKDYEYYREPAGVIYCGDCLEILPLLPDNSVDLVLTDPPYGVSMLRGDSKIKERIVGDEKKWDVSWMAQYHAIIWGGNQFCHQLPISSGWLVWYKYLPDYAPNSQCEIAWSNITKTIRHYKEQYTGFMRAREGHWHPAQKPIKLFTWCIAIALKKYEVQTILDPFLGSGTTAVAAKNLGRKFIGIEIEEKYCEIAKQRLAQEVLL